MRVLVETEMAGLVAALSAEEKAEILMCLFEYPDRKYDHQLWLYMKKQIDRDQTAYQNRCKGLSVSRKNRWAKQSEQIENGI